MDNGILANINLSWLSPKKIREMIIIGDKGMLIYDDTSPDRKIEIYDKRVDTSKLSVDHIATSNIIYREGDIHVPSLNHTEPLREVCLHFLDSVKNGTKPLSDGESGLNVVKVLEAIELSARSDGAKIRLD